MKGSKDLGICGLYCTGCTSLSLLINYVPSSICEITCPLYIHTKSMELIGDQLLTEYISTNSEQLFRFLKTATISFLHSQHQQRPQWCGLNDVKGGRTALSHLPQLSSGAPGYTDSGPWKGRNAEVNTLRTYLPHKNYFGFNPSNTSSVLRPRRKLLGIDDVAYSQ